MEIAPIPEEFMSAAPVVSLSTVSGRKEKGGGVWEVRGGRTQAMKKKDKRKFRHTKWLQSKQVASPATAAVGVASLACVLK